MLNHRTWLYAAGKINISAFDRITEVLYVYLSQKANEGMFNVPPKCAVTAAAALLLSYAPHLN